MSGLRRGSSSSTSIPPQRSKIKKIWYNLNFPYWFHLDLRPLPHIEFVQDAQDLSNFPDDSFGLIESRNMIEHVGRWKVVAMLREWFRVLMPGGRAFLTVPSIIGAARRILAGEWSWEQAQDIFGMQDYPENFHYTCWTEEWFWEILSEVGFIHPAITRSHGRIIQVQLDGSSVESGEDGFQMSIEKGN